jgi:putative hydrolase of the HAD superfamily
MKMMLFDLGGVLIKNIGYAVIQKMTGNTLDIEFIKEIWINSLSVKKYESGKINSIDFSENAIKELKLSIMPAQFIEHFKSWVVGYYDNAVEYLVMLRKKFNIGCLTNSNDLHWKKAIEEWKIEELFDYRFGSHIIGKVKPNIQIFQHVLNNVPFNADEIAFLTIQSSMLNPLNH